MQNTGELPLKEHSFVLDVEGAVTKTRFLGEFKCKIPSQKDLALIAKHRAFLNGDMAEYLDIHTLQLHNRISYLRFTLIEFPTFWKDSDLGYDLYDYNVINEIYKQATEFESKWLKAIWGEEESKENAG